MKIPFSPPYIDEAVINEVVDSLRSGWITSGPKVKALEEEIKSFSGAKEVLCVNSWTSGAIMMLRWLGVKEGDEVIVPAYTYSATALAVLHAGAKPVWWIPELILIFRWRLFVKLLLLKQRRLYP